MDADDHDNRRKIIMAEFDRCGYDEKYKTWWLTKYNRQNGLDGDDKKKSCTSSIFMGGLRRVQMVGLVV